MSIANVYDFETAIETAVAALFTSAGMTASTPATAAQFQKARPRVELIFVPGQANQSYHNTGSGRRNASWSGQLTVQIITSSGEDSSYNATHRTYRAAVRNVMATAVSTINAELTYHKIQSVIEAGTTPSYKPEDGVEVSRLVYAIDFGVEAGAWSELGD